MGSITRARSIIPGAYYHVTTRGNNRQALFGDVVDYCRYLGELRTATQQCQVIVLAYALMPNHVHVVVRDHAGLLSKCMQLLNTRYACYVKGRYARSGHLYQGRFYARLMETEMPVDRQLI